ncbi:MAG: 4'-phosphopantetheinyl transferase superfamily protein [Paludibacter sp.]
MPISNIISAEGAQLLVWEITERVDELKLLLENWDENEFEQIASAKRRLEYLGIRVALKELLGEEVRICYTEEGKPYLLNKKHQISVSHSGRWVAVMIHPERSVGVDIEVPTDKIRKVSTRFLSGTEQKELSGGEDVKQLQIAWSAKEALYKIIGKEAVDFASQLRIFPFETNGTGEILAEHIPTKDIYQLHYIQHLEYTLVYCLA